jgi:hypothetical protein
MPRAQCNAEVRVPDCDCVACTEDCGSDVQRGAHVVQATSHAHRHAHVSVPHVVASESDGAAGRALCSHGKRLLSRT